MKRQYFGTDGVRGEFGGPVMHERFAWRLGCAAARWLAANGTKNARVLIGRDTRFSGPLLERALAAGFTAAGAEVHTLGVVPTPAVSFAVRHFDAALGVVITASHNPATDNGIKFFNASGAKLDDAAEAALEACLPVESAALLPPEAPDPLPSLPAEDVYLARLGQLLPPRALAGWTVVVDAANGAAYRTTPELLRRFGAQVVALNDAPDGHNINHECGSQHPQAMCRRVRESQARLGVAHDGDADRLILADETGAELDGDEILAILAAHALRAGTLNHRTLVATVQSNLGLKRLMEQLGGTLVQTAVGDRYVLEAMVAGGFNLGGESSGHIICTDVAPCGDGLAAALLVLAAMRAAGKPLSELRRGLRKFPQLSRNLRVARKTALEDLPGVQDAIRAAEQQLGGDGRVLVRYSGTEPKLRLLVEGPDANVIAALMDAIEAAARRELTDA